MKRADFSPKVKEIIASRTAYRCSFPGCNATLIGPGMEPDQVDNIGQCAHIYAAGKKGPRCNNNLSEADLQKPENVMYCRDMTTKAREDVCSLMQFGHID